MKLVIFNRDMPEILYRNPLTSKLLRIYFALTFALGDLLNSLEMSHLNVYFQANEFINVFFYFKK